MDPLDGQKKKSAVRPSMQIYKPPGLRNSGGAKQCQSSASKSDDSDSGRVSADKPKASGSVPVSSKLGGEQPAPAKHTPPPAVKKSATDQSNRPQPSIARTLSNVIKESRKKPLIQKDIEEITQTFQNLNVVKEKHLIEEFLAGNMENEAAARTLGQYLVQYAIEENKTKYRTVARLCAALLECPSGVAFHQGLVTAILQYYDCRDQLRVDHLRVWVGFLNFVAELYGHVGFTYEGEMVEVIFNIFDYMLKPPVLEGLKIEELECMIASLLSVGHALERQCPDELGRLKNQMRDAFIEVSEPWARKMILLLMELSASSWTLPQESHDYYFG